MTLERFCDLVWLEIWDDCPPLGDQGQYRRIMSEYFIECKDPWNIIYETHDDKGKKVKKRLAPIPTQGAKPGMSAIDQARALAERLKGGTLIDAKAQLEAVQAAKTAAELASPPSGR